MELLKQLASEHDLFRELAGRIERTLHSNSPGAFLERRSLLRVLLPALSRHEKIENLVFALQANAYTPELRQLMSAIEGEHEKIASLRRGILAVLEQSDATTANRLTIMVRALLPKLKSHLNTEERRLWPCFTSRLSPTAERLISERVGALDRSLRENEVMQD